MTKIGQMGQVKGAQCKDTTPPPTPQVTTSLAFIRGSSEARFVRSSSSSRSTGRDPAYIELNNVEVGTTIQMINLSANPEAVWDKKSNIVDMTLTGRDVQGRKASMYLTAEQMDKINLKPGDMLQLRAVDPQGNASGAVTTELEPDDWANRRVRDNGVDSLGSSINALDGENTRKNLIIKAVNDTRPPQVVENNLKLVADDKGVVSLQGNMALEPRSTVSVLNQRTGKTFSGNVGDNRILSINLGQVKDGDPIVLTPRDNEGVQGKNIMLTYSSCSKDGKAATFNPLGAQLPGVL